jgi:hypothetical protein
MRPAPRDLASKANEGSWGKVTKKSLIFWKKIHRLFRGSGGPELLHMQWKKVVLRAII